MAYKDDKLGAIWVNNDSAYINGTVEKDIPAGTKITIMPNQYATAENRQPTHHILVRKDKTAVVTPQVTPEVIESDIPF